MEKEGKRRIYLVGFMGVGKSTLGRQLAQHLGYRFLDIDKLFEHKYKISIHRFFEKYDEALFRKLGHELLEETFSLENVVVSTGGGTPCYFDAMDKMNAHGVTVYLEMDQESLFRRLTRARRKRPLVTNLSENALRDTISDKLTERLPYYSRAMMTHDAGNADIAALALAIQKDSL